ncbi:cytochrome c, class I [Paraglaciecola sp. T6c]|uniref:c-type cytochrome n=1 Tax=Pseudoalteromonas atlantica (strain T6c / ATCC BAA-1087) TaxID=3042615 RepID=UPI00005C529B|nr:cytochrome c [Paraglaciecola sp. T6c]ABG38688.1 cytochrome c, class I [Paraglaciecola sp. T6c]
MPNTIQFKHITSALGLAIMLLQPQVSYANDAHTKMKYTLFCSGCHTADGRGSGDPRIPDMRNFVGYFAAVEGGREFLIQVPGVSTAPLKSKELAQIVNWMLRSFSADQLPDDFKPFDEQEVERLRQYVLRSELGDTRKALVTRIEEYKKK